MSSDAGNGLIERLQSLQEHWEEDTMPREGSYSKAAQDLSDVLEDHDGVDATNEEEQGLFARTTGEIGDVSRELKGDEIDVFGFTGPIGKCMVLGKGSPLKYQVDAALLDAIEEWLNEIVWIDEEDTGSIEEVQHELQDQLSRNGPFDRFEAEHLAEETASNLHSWEDYHDTEGDDVE